jgi:cell division protein FtsB
MDMLHRNRKRGSLQVGVIARVLVGCVYVALIGLGYIWNKNQIYRLGDEIKKREGVLAAVEKRNAMLAAQLAQLKSPAYLEARNQQYHLGLTAPREGQTVRMWEPTAAWDAQFMARRTASSPKGAVAQR